jgi:glucose-1-phosphate adenylyltransferase
MSKDLMDKFVSLILGGGAGTRLYPLTKDRSKPAVPIGGKYRLIDIPISNCLHAGLNRMFVLTQFNSASLNRHIKNTYHFDAYNNGFVDILAAEQTKENMSWFQGTADAVRQSVRNIVHEDFEYVMILSGDQLYQMDIAEVSQYHINQKADITIATIPCKAELATAFGIMKVKADGFIEAFTEKPGLDILPEWKSEVSEELKSKGKDYLASMGIYIFNRKVLGKLLESNPDSDDFGKEIIPAALEGGFKVASYAYNGYWEDIGDIKSFFEANLELTDSIPAFDLFNAKKKIFSRARQLPPSKIVGSTISNSIMAEGAICHASIVERSVIGIRSRIGNNSVIKSCYIMGNDFYQSLDELSTDKYIGIGANCHIENAIIDKQAKIGDNTTIIGDSSLEDIETENYSIKRGIVVVNKKAVIPPNSKIGLPLTKF